MYLLVGGTGLLGGRVAARMRERGVPVRALVRPTSDGSSLSMLGVDVVRGDMRDRASIDAALAGVDTVVTTANAMARNLAGDTTISIHEVDEVGNANLIEAAAARAGVARFVFVSAEREELEAGTPFTRAKLATEAAWPPLRSGRSSFARRPSRRCGYRRWSAWTCPTVRSASSARARHTTRTSPWMMSRRQSSG